jgi:hypothetical protein
VKHTPGPWHIKHEWNIFSGERLVANTGGYTSNRDGEAVRQENIANANLVAAAPDLLDAAERVLRIVGGDPDRPDYAETIRDLALAIKKSRGES